MNINTPPSKDIFYKLNFKLKDKFIHYNSRAVVLLIIKVYHYASIVHENINFTSSRKYFVNMGSIGSEYFESQ